MNKGRILDAITTYNGIEEQERKDEEEYSRLKKKFKD